MAGAYLAMALVLMHPVLGQVTTRAIGGQFDLWGTLWIFDYIKDCVLQGHLPGHTDAVFYPVGTNVLGLFAHFLLPVLSVPLQLAFGLQAAYNLLALASLAASALAAAALLLELAGSRPAAFVGGALLMTSQFVWMELLRGSLELVFLPFLLLAVRAVVRMHPDRRGAATWELPLWFVLTALSNWFYGLLLGLFVLIYGFATARQLQGARRGGYAARLGGSLLVSTVLVVPLAWPLVQSLQGGPAASLAPSQINSATMRGYQEAMSGRIPIEDLSPAELPAFESCSVVLNSDDLAAPLKVEPRYFAHRWDLPFAVLACFAVVGYASRGRERGPWLWTLASFAVLALGPFLRTGGTRFQSWQTLVPLPFYYAYHLIPIFHLASRPARFGIMALVSLLVLAGMGLAFFFDRYLREPRARLAWTIALPSLLLAEAFLGPAPPLARLEVPAYYQALAAEPDDFALIEMPFSPLPLNNYNALYRYYQATHHKKILNSASVRLRDGVALRDFAAQNSFLAALLIAQDAPDRLAESQVSRADVEWLASQQVGTCKGFRYVLAHTRVPPDPFPLIGLPERKALLDARTFALLDACLGPPEPRPGGILAWRLDRSLPMPATVSGSQLLADSLDVPWDSDRTGRPATLSAQGLAASLAGASRPRRHAELSFWWRGDPGQSCVVELSARVGNTPVVSQFPVALASADWERVVRQVSFPEASKEPFQLTWLRVLPALGAPTTRLWITELQLR